MPVTVLPGCHFLVKVKDSGRIVCDSLIKPGIKEEHMEREAKTK